MDLHTLIAAKVEEAERQALAASPGPWSLGDDGDEVLAADGIPAFEAFALSGRQQLATAAHAARHDPVAVLRRCEADRRVLARHSVDPDRSDSPWYATACEGCGTSGHLCDPVTENINDCPELLDLAHAMGITKEELAALDRPTGPPLVPVQPRLVRTTPHRLTVDQVSATFRP